MTVTSAVLGVSYLTHVPQARTDDGRQSRGLLKFNSRCIIYKDVCGMNADFQMILMFNYLCTIMLCTVGLYTGHAKTPDLVQPHPRNTQCIHQHAKHTMHTPTIANVDSKLIIMKSPIFTPGHTGVRADRTPRCCASESSVLPRTGLREELPSFTNTDRRPMLLVSICCIFAEIIVIQTTRNTTSII